MIRLIVYTFMVALIAFTSGFLWTGGMLNEKYQYDMYEMSTYLSNQIVGCNQQSIQKERWYLAKLDIQDQLCTDFMVDMYNDMCDENPKKSSYDHLRDL